MADASQDPESKARERLEAEIRELMELRGRYEDAKEALSPDQPPPFVWDLAFVEIFEDDNPGFDIVIGNPPYVRQQKIRDYRDRFEPKDYLTRLNDGLRAMYPGFMGKARRISGRADYYIYFYLHALSLVADKGAFCFITSNSWLDVDFGKDLQEFFLRHGHLKMVIDNRAKRSFAQADVNTVIVLAGQPQQRGALGDNEMKERQVRFVAFRVPFEEAVGPVVFSEIEDGALYEPLAGFRVLKRPEYRSVLWDQRALYLDGAGADGARRRIGLPPYKGNKWGGRYLRAPDILHRAIRGYPSVLLRLAKLAKVHGYIHDNCTGPHYPDVPFIKSIRDAQQIRLTRSSAGVVAYGVKSDGKSRLVAPILVARTFNDRLFALWNRDGIFAKEFYRVMPHDKKQSKELAALLNSTWVILQFEIVGIAGLGGGGLKFSMSSVSELLVPNIEVLTREQRDKLEMAFNCLSGRLVRNVFEEFGFTVCRTRRCQHPEHPYEQVRPGALTLAQVKQASPDRFELDSVVFDVLGLSDEERLEVYRAVVELVKDRLVKARSV